MMSCISTRWSVCHFGEGMGSESEQDNLPGSVEVSALNLGHLNEPEITSQFN